MRIQFWMNEEDAFPMIFAANHIAAIQIVGYVNGAGEGAHDVIVYANGAKFRFPYTSRNVSAKTAWEIYVEGQK